MENTKRWIIYAVIILGSYALITFTMPRFPDKPHGIVLPAIKKPVTYPETPADHIKLLMIPPIRYQTLGTINVESHYHPGDQTVMQNAVNFAKTLAANTKANAILINAMGHDDPGSHNRIGLTLSRFVLRGKTLHVGETAGGQ